MPACRWADGGRGVERGVLRGDVDADGRSDRVSVVARYRARPGCRLALRVQLGAEGRLFARLYEAPDATGADLQRQPWPRLLALVKVDPRPGLQPVVSVQLGSSTVFVGVFAIRGGHLVRLATPLSAFAAGASAVATAVDCWHGARSGIVVSSFAQANVHGWDVSRGFYHLVGNRFRPGGELPAVRVKTLAALPEFRGDGLPIFPSCTVARVRHL